MTGFGSASRSRAGASVSVEARSVNNRFLKVSIRTPTILSSREHEIEAMVRERMVRGTLYLNIRVVLDQNPLRVKMNESAVEEYLKLFRKLSRASGLSGEASLDLLARVPGVFEAEEIDPTLSKEVWEVVRETVGQALDRLLRMRKREGANLKRDFRKRRGIVADLVKHIEKRAPLVAKEQAERLRTRISRLLPGKGFELGEKDLFREIAILAERSDVTEEVTRLASHLDQYGRALSHQEEVGRRLEFLVQEMHRETNTIASKSVDVAMSRVCVDLKVELDRLKEQVQNVE